MSPLSILSKPRSEQMAEIHIKNMKISNKEESPVNSFIPIGGISPKCIEQLVNN
jgi:hypothetical protein